MSLRKPLIVFTLLSCLVVATDAAAAADDGNDEYGDDWYDGGIFGSMADTDIVIGSVSFLIVISAVLLVENIFHLLEHMAHDTPFEDMVLAIEKELMIVGTMAFILKLIITTSDFIEYDWYHALEFADTLVPVTSFVVALMGVFLIIMSIRVCRHWIRSYHLHLFELLDEYMEHSGHWVQVGNWSFMPFSYLNMEMEFRIFHSIFCEQYNIQRKAFAFDEYVYLKFEKFLLSVLKIQEINWVIVMFIVLVNWLRYYLHWDIHECVVKNDKRYVCQGTASIEDFIYCGIAMFAVTLALAIASRYYELKLMATSGIRSSDDYAVYLQAYEDAHADDAPAESSKLAEKDLKIAVEISKSYKEDHGKSSMWDIKDWGSNLKGYFIGMCRLHKKDAPVIPHADGLHDDDAVDQFAKGFLDGQHPKVDGGAKTPLTPKKSSSPPSSPTFSKPAELLRQETSPNIPGLSANMKARTKALIKKRVKINKHREAEVEEKETGPEALMGKDDFRSIFWLGKPAWYFNLVQTQVMFIAFYLSLWICNFLTVSYVIAQGDSTKHAKWVFLSLLPGVLSMALYMYCVRTAALLRSIVEVDTDAMLEIIEQTEGTRFLGQMMRTRMLEKLRDMGDPEQELKVLFEEIDDNNSNLLSRREFQIFLEALGITFSRKKWSQIFVEIDLNNDDEISFRELFLFLFPDNDSAKLEEARRLARIGLRVRDHAAKLAEKAAAGSSVARRDTNLYMKDAMNKKLVDHGRQHLKSSMKGGTLAEFEGLVDEHDDIPFVGAEGDGA
jgi:Ca2+-binding EF-hand superfamily protein